MKGSCDCGGVVLEIPALPNQINACPCSCCRRAGAHWAYFPPGSVKVRGETVIYRRATRQLAFHRCPNCGMLSHWTGITGKATKMGVNMKNFDAGEIASIPVVALG